MSLCQLRAGLERGFEGRNLAWALDFPGVFAYGKSDAEALSALPGVMAEFENWIGRQNKTKDIRLTNFMTQVEESFDNYFNAENIPVNAFFEDDRRPLEAEEIGNALLIHAWQRQELLAGVKDLKPELMTRILPGQRWNINGVLNHIGRTELRYLGNMNLPLPSAEFLIHNPFRILELSLALVQTTLPDLVGNSAVIEKDGELWSARKLLRRLLWHQRDHIGHIQQFVEMANQD